MLEEYIGKNVKIVSGSYSGVSIDHLPGITSGVVVTAGTLVKFDSEYIKLKNVQTMRNDVCNTKCGMVIPNFEARVETYNEILVSKKSIITIAPTNE